MGKKLGMKFFIKEYNLLMIAKQSVVKQKASFMKWRID